jgi:hypothetical protein
MPPRPSGLQLVGPGEQRRAGPGAAAPHLAQALPPPPTPPAEALPATRDRQGSRSGGSRELEAHF